MGEGSLMCSARSTDLPADVRPGAVAAWVRAQEDGPVEPHEGDSLVTSRREHDNPPWERYMFPCAALDEP
jgi:hypothetical protein